MAVFAPILEWARNKYWAFYGDANGNGDIDIFVYPRIFPMILGRGPDLLVRGITIGYFGPASHPIIPQVITGLNWIPHLLTDYATALDNDSASYAPLDIPVEVKPDTPLIRLYVTDGFTAGDYATITAWGEFIPTPETPQAVPVSLQEIKLWKPKQQQV